MRIATKSKTKTVISVLLIVLLVGAAVTGIVTLVKRDGVEIRPSAFEVGALDPDTGRYVERMDAIYTEKAFSAQGLSIVPDFKASNVRYQIFFYDADDRFLEATEILTGAYVEEQLLPTYARVVIYPSTLDDDGNQIEDFKVGRFDVRSIAKQLTITVDADQDKVYSENLFEAGDTEDVSDHIKITAYDGILLHLTSAVDGDTTYTVTFYDQEKDEEGTTTMTELSTVSVTLQSYSIGEYKWYTIDDIPAGATHMTVTTPGGAEVGVYGISR